MILNEEISLYFIYLLIIFSLASCKAANICDSNILTEAEAANAQPDLEISPGIEIVHTLSERTYYETLKQAEDEATIIVRAAQRGLLTKKWILYMTISNLRC
jgi:hypothetical protein